MLLFLYTSKDTAEVGAVNTFSSEYGPTTFIFEVP